MTAASLLPLQAQIHREARAHGFPVPGLMTWLLERRNLEAAFDRVRGTDGANTPGPDGVTAGDVEPRAGAWLSQLAEEMMQGAFRPAPPRVVNIPKKPGSDESRTIGILNLRDRVVHAALKQVLEPVVELLFAEDSYGFRPGRSVAGALSQAVRLLSPHPGSGAAFLAAAPLDVADCFNTIDHEALGQGLERVLADEPLLGLVRRVLRAGGREAGRWWWKRWRGLVQGSSLSPLLCNLALHPLDEALAELGRASHNGVVALRYADDLLVLGRDAALARQAVACARQALGQLRQKLKEPAAVVMPREQGVSWLGVELRVRPHRWNGAVRFGYLIPDGKVQSMLERLTEMTTPPSARIDASAFNLGRWVVSINDQLRDWRQAYLYADNAPAVFAALDEHCRERVGLLLHAVTGKPFRDVQACHRARMPRGFWTWQVNGVRLTVLSSLAPHAPDHLTRRPPWVRLRGAEPPPPLEPPKPAAPAADAPPAPLEEHIP